MCFELILLHYKLRLFWFWFYRMWFLRSNYLDIMIRSGTSGSKVTRYITLSNSNELVSNINVLLIKLCRHIGIKCQRHMKKIYEISFTYQQHRMNMDVSANVVGTSIPFIILLPPFVPPSPYPSPSPFNNALNKPKTEALRWRRPIRRCWCQNSDEAWLRSTSIYPEFLFWSQCHTMAQENEKKKAYHRWRLATNNCVVFVLISNFLTKIMCTESELDDGLVKFFFTLQVKEDLKSSVKWK